MEEPVRMVEHRTRRRAATVLVCRGCCCGSPRKHPDVDHDAQLDTLRAAAHDEVVVHVVDCLGPCSESNVIVVRSPGAPRRRWFGRMLDADADADATAAMATWLSGGARGPVPAALEPHVLDRSVSTVAT